MFFKSHTLGAFIGSLIPSRNSNQVLTAIMAYDFHDYVSHSHTVPMRFDKDSDFMK